MKVTFCLIVHNEARTLRASLDHLYAHAHQIIVCEGAISVLRHELDIGPRSTDGTNEILDDYPDPDGKLLVIRQPWETKDEMSAAYAMRSTGDLIWHVDADEFYDANVFDQVRAEFRDDTSLGTLEVPHQIFWKSPRHILVDENGNERWCRVPRVMRNVPGMRVSHNPVRRIIDGRVDEARRPPRDARIFCWHYGWNDDARVRAKMRIYATRDWKSTRSDWIESVWDRWQSGQPDAQWPDGVHPAKSIRVWPRRFTRPHPDCVTAILRNLSAVRDSGDSSDFHPLFSGAAESRSTSGSVIE